MTQETTKWTEFHRAALSRPPRELLRRTLGCFQLDGATPGVAVDLGCGSGTDTLEMLRRGWTVHSVDVNPGGIQMLQEIVPPEFKDKLFTHVTKFEDFQFPRCGLVWAGYSLPFCSAAQWPGLWQRMCAALETGGRLSGDLFGEQHAFAEDPDVMTMSEVELRALIESKQLVVEAFDVENGVRPSGRQLTRWHAFGIAVRKPEVVSDTAQP